MGHSIQRTGGLMMLHFLPYDLQANITNTACGITKLCVSSVANCNPTGNSSCFFASTQYNNGMLTVEMSGTTSGYVALGLTPTVSPLSQIGTIVFVCGNNNTNVFFETATQNGSVLNPANVSIINIPTVQGSVTSNQTLIQCIINITVSPNILGLPSLPANVQLPVNLSILNGSTNGTSLGIPTTVFNSNGTLDLANPKSNVSPTVLFNITRTGCGSTKLCVSSETTCNLTGNSSCFFSSVQVKNQTLSFELSGTTTGYVALGLIKQNSTFVFVCGNNSNSFFFQTATQNNTNLTSANVTTVHNFQGVVAQNQTLIQCIFNTSTSFNISTKAVDTMYQVIIMNGTTNGEFLQTCPTYSHSIVAYITTSLLKNPIKNNIIS
ncbi:hypothetical protein QTP70_026524 [Hemibagrus guttatus]|uniref:Uncharacterized protein n=1 Tax=Hemibagrus guttatus TaxID=175788 RepID=A0AAE0VAW7_9TELE|nr:hypothetical protein QTP70_026524 [Hemibagrus guttatus]